MSSKKQVKQSLELTLSLAESLGPLTRSEAKEFFGLLGELNKVFSKVVDPDAHDLKPEPSPEVVKHPVDTLLKKGKVTLSEGRYKQLVIIYDALILMGGVTFLSAKQNQHVTWFPIDWNGNKSAALFLGAEWTIEPLSVKANGELKGDWENFDLNEFMVDFDFDQDEY